MTHYKLTIKTEDGAFTVFETTVDELFLAIIQDIDQIMNKRVKDCGEKTT